MQYRKVRKSSWNEPYSIIIIIIKEHYKGTLAALLSGFVVRHHPFRHVKHGVRIVTRSIAARASNVTATRTGVARSLAVMSNIKLGGKTRSSVTVPINLAQSAGTLSAVRRCDSNLPPPLPPLLLCMDDDDGDDDDNVMVIAMT